MLAFLAGCSGERETLYGQAGENGTAEDIISENSISGNAVSENEITEGEVSLNGISVEGETESENAEEEQLRSIDIDTYNIVNIDTALENFWQDGYAVERKVTIGNYHDSFPVELQEALLYLNDGIDDERDDSYQKYLADLEKITPENMGDTLAEEIKIATQYEAGNSSLYAVDFDGDGIDEYVTYGTFGTGRGTGPLVVKYDEDRWVWIGGTHPYFADEVSGVLEYEGRYYILTGSSLVWWNDDAGTIPASAFELDCVVNYDSSCWSKFYVSQRYSCGYTPYEIYSSNAGDDSIDYLEDINWETLEADDTEKVDFNFAIWKSDDLFLLDYGWERVCDGERYMYVVFKDYYQDRMKIYYDRGLAVMRQTEDGSWEIVKVYYLSADCNIEFVMGEN